MVKMSALFLGKGSIRFVYWIVAIQLVVLVPVVSYSAYVTSRVLAQAESTDRQLLVDKATSTAAALTREVERVRAKIQLLALQDAAIAGDAEAMHAMSIRVRDSDPVIKQISAASRDGQLVFSTFNRTANCWQRRRAISTAS